MAAPVEVQSVTVWNTLRRSATENNIPIIVDFHAEWCQPCKSIAPIYHQLANQHHRAVFLRVDVDRNQPIAAKYNVTAMPTFLATAAAHYTRGLESAPDSAVLHANRALMHIRQIQLRDPASKAARMTLRRQAMRDANAATDLEPRWGKGWVRSAEAVLLSGDDEVLEDTPAETRAESKRMMLSAVLETLFNAANLSDGKLRADALAMRDDVRARLEALS